MPQNVKCPKNVKCKSVEKYAPTSLIADNAPGFTESFGFSIKRVNCWAHAIIEIQFFFQCK